MNWPDKKYNVIYADPPWSYDNTGVEGSASSHYKTMSLEEIKALPVKSISRETCALFLWATFPNLKEALLVIESWGFEYKTLGFSWIKTEYENANSRFGIGFYTKSNCEVCLLGVKGSVSSMVKSNKISSSILAPRGKHSEKPHEVRRRIERLFGDVTRIELFARCKAEGWDAWGNQVSEIQTLPF